MWSVWTHLTSESFSEAAIFTFQWSFQWRNKENQQNKTKQTLFLQLGLLPGFGFIQRGQSWTTTRKWFEAASQPGTNHSPLGTSWEKHPKGFHSKGQASIISVSRWLELTLQSLPHCYFWDSHCKVIMRKLFLQIRCFTLNHFRKHGCSLIFWTFPQPQTV